MKKLTIQHSVHTAGYNMERGLDKSIRDLKSPAKTAYEMDAEWQKDKQYLPPKLTDRYMANCLTALKTSYQPTPNIFSGFYSYILEKDVSYRIGEDTSQYAF